MDSETLALLGQSSQAPETGTDQDVPPAADQDEHETETPEALIARGEIPEGYTRDPRTKEIRPKKAQGRPRTGTASVKPDTPIQRGSDERPDSKLKGKIMEPVPKWSKGVIAAGMTKLYRRAGRIVKTMDADIGTAIIECAEDCGQAWDELARTNPEVRRVLMKLIGGGAWGSVIMAHLPIVLAVLMKERIAKHIPFMKLIRAAAEPEADGTPNGLSDLLGNMSEEDMQQMANLAQGMFGNMAFRAAQNGTDQ